MAPVKQAFQPVLFLMKVRIKAYDRLEPLDDKPRQKQNMVFS